MCATKQSHRFAPPDHHTYPRHQMITVWRHQMITLTATSMGLRATR